MSSNEHDETHSILNLICELHVTQSSFIYRFKLC